MAENDVWVFVEQKGGNAAKVSLELLSEGHALAQQLGSNICAVLLGNEVGELAVNLGQYGARKVYLLDHQSLQQHQISLYAAVLRDLIRKYNPAVILFGSTPRGRELAPLLAGQVGGGFAGDCTMFRIGNTGYLLVTRPVYNGKLDAKYTFTPRAASKIISVRPNVIGLDEPDKSRKAEIVRVDVSLIENYAITESVTKVVGFIKGDPATIDLREAEIIVCVGRGILGVEDLTIIEKLADALGAPIAGTRPAVEMGLVRRERQIGATGKCVSPKLYIACGISGASQHVQGIRNAEYIIAINTDRKAPILGRADMGIVGDIREVVPEMTRQIRERQTVSIAAAL